MMMDKKNALAFDDIKVHVRFKLFASCTWFVFHGPDCRIVCIAGSGSSPVTRAVTGR